MKFATKPVRHYLPHYKDVATLPWKINKSNFSRYLTDADEKQSCNSGSVAFFYFYVSHSCEMEIFIIGTYKISWELWQ